MVDEKISGLAMVDNVLLTRILTICIGICTFLCNEVTNKIWNKVFGSIFMLYAITNVPFQANHFSSSEDIGSLPLLTTSGLCILRG